MIQSLAFIFLAGLAFAGVCRMCRIPRIVGMLAVGVALGPSSLNLLDPGVLAISPDLRALALVVILLKAGLSLNLEELKRVKRPAVLLSFVPASFELAGYVILAPLLLGLTPVEAAVMGAVLAAVSPAVLVTRMVQIAEDGYGTDKGIPQMLVAGCSCDNIYVVVLFSTFSGLALGHAANVASLAHIPEAIVLGVLAGTVAGFVLRALFETAFTHGHLVRNSMKVVVVLGTACLLMSLERWLADVVPVSGLLATVSMAVVLKVKCVPAVAHRLSEKFGKLWIAAEVILFVLVGAAVDLHYTAEAGLSAVCLIVLALVFRAAGVALCLLGTNLNAKERVFCMLAYVPKATVQAAMGSVPLAMGLACGHMVLAVSVLAILITAPAGEIAIQLTHARLLKMGVPEKD